MFDTARSRFTETDRLTLQRVVPHLGQLRRNALARRTYPALIDSTAPARMRLLRLTPRERVVLARAAAGETNTVIAQALFVSPGTVRKHLEHIYDKLDVRTRTEAAALYTQERVVADSAGLAPLERADTRRTSLDRVNSRGFQPRPPRRELLAPRSSGVVGTDHPSSRGDP